MARSALEGVTHDLEQRDLQPLTRKRLEELRTALNTFITTIGNLSGALDTSRGYIEELLGLGFPQLPKVDFEVEALSDLDQNLATQVEARKLMKTMRLGAETGQMRGGPQHAPSVGSL